MSYIKERESAGHGLGLKSGAGRVVPKVSDLDGWAFRA